MISRTEGRELGMLVLVMIGLLLPVIPIPGDAMSRMDVQFRTDGMTRSHSFGAQLPHSVCAVMASALAYGEPASGDFTSITCTP